ncbi:MAG: ArsR/SmtB family transcription factor [Gemmatimonadota bacterium]
MRRTGIPGATASPTKDGEWTAGSAPIHDPPSERELRRAVELFKVLSHPARLRLVCHLGDGHETTQKALMEEFGWPQSTTARYLGILRNAGLVTARREGGEVLLSIGSPVALRLFQTVCAWVNESPGEGERRLDSLSGVLLTPSSNVPAPSPPVGHRSTEVLL